jgi:hypothetical protein
MRKSVKAAVRRKPTPLAKEKLPPAEARPVLPKGKPAPNAANLLLQRVQVEKAAKSAAVN